MLVTIHFSISMILLIISHDFLNFKIRLNFKLRMSLRLVFRKPTLVNGLEVALVINSAFLSVS